MNSVARQSSSNLPVLNPSLSQDIPHGNDIDKLSARLNNFTQKLFDLNQSQSGYNICDTFLKIFEKLKTEASIESALHKFSKFPTKLKKGIIPVQTTSVARRKTKIGGVIPIPSWRPLKRLGPEHNNDTKKGKRPRNVHALSYCVRENINLSS